MLRTFHDSILLDHIPGHTGSGTGSTGGGTGTAASRGWSRDRWGPLPNPNNSAALQAILAAMPPNLRENGEQLDEFHWIDPSTRIVYELGTNTDGEPSFRKMSITDSKNFLNSAAAGGSGGSSSGGSGSPSRMASDDPRYWEQQATENAQRQAELDFDYASLDSEERRDYDQMYWDNVQAGMDADTARRNAIVNLVQTRNSLAADVASTSLSAAEAGAKFAGNPRDSVADILYQNTQGGTNAYSSTNNAAFGQYQTALDNRFQKLFGGVGEDLDKAREYRDSIPLPEFFEPVTPQMRNEPPPAINELEQLRNALGGAGLRDDGLTGELTQKGKDFIAWVTATNGGVPPTTAEGGANMNIMEPSMVVGMSGRVYATLAETDPEQLVVKPLPSVMERKKAEKDKGAGPSFLEQTRGAQRFAKGGSINIAGGTLPAAMKAKRPSYAVEPDGRYRGPNPYGPEIPGLTGGIRVGSDPDGTPNNSAGQSAGIDAALRLRAGQPLRFGKARTTGGAVLGGTRSSAPASGTTGGQTDFISAFNERLRQIDPQAVAMSGQDLPDPRLLSWRVWNAMEQDPDLRKYVFAAYSKYGISDDQLLATVQKGRPVGMNAPTQVIYR